MSLAQRGVTSSAYNVIANSVSLVFNLAGSIILARLLEPEVFGVIAFANSTILLTIALPNFGFQAAFLHRTSGESGITEETLRVHFTLKLIFSLVWAALMVAGAAVFAPVSMRWVFWVLTGVVFVAQQMTTITILLTRRVEFRRLAITQVVAAITSNTAAVLLAWRGWGLWSLLSARIVAGIVEVLFLYVIRPIWRPRLGWSKELASYFINYGSKVFTGSLLAQALDRVDDIWTGLALGDRALGFYDKAYTLATYPRQFISVPLTQVAAGTFAQVRDDRERLSRIFSWVSLVMIRANFYVAALLWLVAPELIRLALGARWLPMMDAFRLMLAYTLFDPLKGMIANLLIICGAPNRVIRARIIQLLVLIAGLVTLGPRFDIAGVALAVNTMLVVGIVILYAEARRFVDYAPVRIFGMPLFAMGLGIAATYATMQTLDLAANDWLSGFVKGAAFTLVYAVFLALVERKLLRQLWDILIKLLRSTTVGWDSQDGENSIIP